MHPCVDARLGFRDKWDYIIVDLSWKRLLKFVYRIVIEWADTNIVYLQYCQEPKVFRDIVNVVLGYLSCLKLKSLVTQSIWLPAERSQSVPIPFAMCVSSQYNFFVLK